MVFFFCASAFLLGSPNAGLRVIVSGSSRLAFSLHFLPFPGFMWSGIVVRLFFVQRLAFVFAVSVETSSSHKLLFFFLGVEQPLERPSSTPAKK